MTPNHSFQLTVPGVLVSAAELKRYPDSDVLHIVIIAHRRMI